MIERIKLHNFRHTKFIGTRSVDVLANLLHDSLLDFLEPALEPDKKTAGLTKTGKNRGFSVRIRFWNRNVFRFGFSAVPGPNRRLWVRFGTEPRPGNPEPLLTLVLTDKHHQS